MRAGLDELSRQVVPYAINRMILLTDGRTIGAKKCLELAREAREAGVVINPLGIGSDWDEDLLDDIGKLSGGAKAEFIRTPADAMSVFQQQLQSAIDVAVRNAVLTLRLPMGVSPRRATRVLPIISEFDGSLLSDRQIVLPLGDLEKNNPQAVLIELMIDPRPAGLFRVAQAELSYDVPTLRLTGERVREDIKVTFRSDAMSVGQLNAKVMNFAEKANAHRLVSQVLDEYKRTGKATTRLAPTVTRMLDAETQAALEQIERGRQISAEQVKVISNKTRKLTQRLDL
jgi:Ca-activated chloride channel family protein